MRERLTKHERKLRNALARLRTAHDRLLRAQAAKGDPWNMQDLEERMRRAQEDVDDLVNEPDPDVLRARTMATRAACRGQDQ